MKIVICGSLSATEEIIEVKKSLEKRGFFVEIPHGAKNPEVRKRIKNRRVIICSEEAEEKQKYAVIKKYYEEIKNGDAVLIVNPTKNGIPGYIGGNTFLEMGFAHVLNKPIYCLYPLPDMPYLAELMAFKPKIINGDLKKLKKKVKNEETNI